MRTLDYRWIVLVVSILLAAAPVGAVDGEVDLLFGKKMLDEDALEDVDVDSQDQFGVAVSLDFDWPVSLAIDVLTSSDDATFSETFAGYGYTYTYELDTDVETLEVQVGVRKFWEGRPFVPYVGGGVSWASLDADQVATGTNTPGPTFEFTVVDDSDSDIGFWLNGGIDWRIGNHFSVGLDLRWSDASAELEARPLAPGEPPPRIDLDSGGTHVSLALGYRW